MPFYEVIIKTSQTLLVEADSEDEALEVGCDSYLTLDCEFEEGRLGEVFDEHPGEFYHAVKTIYK